MLEMRWRVLADPTLRRSVDGQPVYYRLELEHHGTDNPDQRIAEDLRLVTSNTLGLSLGLLSPRSSPWGPSSGSVGDLRTAVLHRGRARHHDPGYMVWAAIVRRLRERPDPFHRPSLIPLNFQQQRARGQDFRYSLVRLRRTPRAWRSTTASRAADCSTASSASGPTGGISCATPSASHRVHGRLGSSPAFPIVVAAPRFFAGAITLGTLIQIAGAFGRVQDALGWFVDSYGDLASWKASVDRLLTFELALQRAEGRAPGGISVTRAAGSTIRATSEPGAAERARPPGGHEPVHRGRATGSDLGTVRQRQEHALPRARRHLAVRDRAHPGARARAACSSCRSVLPADRHAARGRHVPLGTGHVWNPRWSGPPALRARPLHCAPRRGRPTGRSR